MAVSIEDVLFEMLGQAGKRYVFGTEASPLDPSPQKFDCSELIEWACARKKVDPRVPDGSWIQARHCRNHGTLLPTIDEGIGTRGALLFRFVGGDPFRGGRPSSSHVAVSLGDGTTIEARGTAYGVGTWAASGRGWTHAALIPGCDYRPKVVPAVPKGKIVGVWPDDLAKPMPAKHLPMWKATADGFVLAEDGARHLGDLAQLGIKPASPITHLFPYAAGYMLYSEGDAGTFPFPG